MVTASQKAASKARAKARAKHRPPTATRGKSPRRKSPRRKSPRRKSPRRKGLSKPTAAETAAAYLKRNHLHANANDLPQDWTADKIWACWQALSPMQQNRTTFLEHLKMYVRDNHQMETIPTPLLSSSFSSYVQQQEEAALLHARIQVAAKIDETKDRLKEAIDSTRNVVQTPSMSAAQKANVKALARLEAEEIKTVDRIQKLTDKAAEASTAKQAADAKKRLEAQQAKLQQTEAKRKQLAENMGLGLIAMAVVLGSIGTTINPVRRWFAESAASPGILPALKEAAASLGSSLVGKFQGGGDDAVRHSQFERQYNRYMHYTNDAAWSVQQAMSDLGF